MHCLTQAFVGGYIKYKDGEVGHTVTQDNDIYEEYVPSGQL